MTTVRYPFETLVRYVLGWHCRNRFSVTFQTPTVAVVHHDNPDELYGVIKSALELPVDKPSMHVSFHVDVAAGLAYIRIAAVSEDGSTDDPAVTLLRGVHTPQG